MRQLSTPKASASVVSRSRRGLARAIACKRKPLSPVLRAVSKIGGVNQTAASMGGDVTPQAVRYWLKKDAVPPDKVGLLARCSGLTLEEFAEHEKQRYIAQAEASPFAGPKRSAVVLEL